MSVIIIPRKHLRQPQGRLSVAPEWVSSGLAALIAPRQFAHSHTSGLLAGSNISQVVTPMGVGASFSSGNSDYLSIPVNLPPTGFMTLVYVGRPGTGNLRERGVILSEGTHQSFTLQFVNYAASIELAIAKGPGENAGIDFSVSQFTGRVSAYVGVFYRDGVAVRMRLHVNGALVGDKYVSNDAAPTYGSAEFNVNKLWYNGTAYYGSHDAILLGSAINRALGEGEADALSANPWQLFRADPIRIYSFPSGPISVSWSSLTASGITQTGARLTLGGITR